MHGLIYDLRHSLRFLAKNRDAALRRYSRLRLRSARTAGVFSIVDALIIPTANIESATAQGNPIASAESHGDQECRWVRTYPIKEAVNELQETVTAYRRKERIL
jgi:hypothetical protein